jgi:hypothetical protein
VIKRGRHIISSLLLVLFLWQLSIVCVSYKFDNEQIAEQIAYLLEELQEDNDGLSDGALEEIQKEEIEEEFYFSLTDFEFNRLKSKPFHSVKEAFYPNIYSKNPFSPPEIIG